MKNFVQFKVLSKQFLLCVANCTLSLTRLHSVLPPTLATATGKCHPFVTVIRVKLILSIPKNRNGFFLWLHRPMPTSQPVGQAVSYHTAPYTTPHRAAPTASRHSLMLCCRLAWLCASVERTSRTSPMPSPSTTVAGPAHARSGLHTAYELNSRRHARCT